MRKLLMTALLSALMLCLCGCEPPASEETSTTTEAVTTTAETSASETTTSKIGGFIVYDEMPEDGGTFEWEEVDTAE